MKPESKRKVISNIGMMDTFAALNWIRENIRGFGGDPTRVTLLGYGTGAAIVNFMIASPAVPSGNLRPYTPNKRHSLSDMGAH